MIQNRFSATVLLGVQTRLKPEGIRQLYPNASYLYRDDPSVSTLPGSFEELKQMIKNRPALEKPVTDQYTFIVWTDPKLTKEDMEKKVKENDHDVLASVEEDKFLVLNGKSVASTTTSLPGRSLYTSKNAPDRACWEEDWPLIKAKFVKASQKWCHSIKQTLSWPKTRN